MKKQEVMTIQMMPSRSGLVNTGGQATVPEPSWWEAKNVTIGADGRLAKRPGLRQWGQTIKAPLSGGISWQEIFSDLSDFNVRPDNTTNDSHVVLATGQAHFFTETLSEVLGSIPLGSASIIRIAQPSDGSLESGETGKVDFRMMFRAAAPLPAISSTTITRGFAGSFKNDTTSTVGFMFAEAGIYIWSGAAYSLVTGTDVNDGLWHTIEFRMTSSSSVDIVIDDNDPVTKAYGNGGDLTIGTNQAGLHVTPNANGLVDVEVALMQSRSGNENIVGTPITNLYEWFSIDPVVQHLIVVADTLAYTDRDWSGRFVPFATVSPGELTLFTPFQENLVVINPLDPARLWSGHVGTAPEAFPTEAPSNITVATQHQGRLWVARRDVPLRVYFSAANDLEDWSWEEFDSGTGESGSFPIPDAVGEKVTFLQGDYFGQLIIGTTNSVYMISGSSVDTYTLNLISSRVGYAGPRAGARAAGDVIFMSKHGIHNQQTIQEYGDISTRYISSELRALWQRNSNFGMPKIMTNYRSSVVHAPHLGRTYMCVQTQEDARPSRVFELNHDTGQWSGPWTVECEAATFTLFTPEAVPAVVFGDTVGRVATATDDRKLDFETDAYEYKLRSARFDGRSISPQMTRLMKKWVQLRLYVLPRSSGELTVSWHVDGQPRDDGDDFNQNVYNFAEIGSATVPGTFILNQSSIVDSETIGVMTIDLDMVGRWFEFTVSQGVANEDAIIVGCEIDFVVAQQDQEN